MDEIKNFENEEIVEAEPEEVEAIETEEVEENDNSLAKLAIGVLAIGGAVTAAALFIRKNREKWALKYLAKRGYVLYSKGDHVYDAENEEEPEVEIESEEK